jgi:hypothetical protein
LPFDLPDSPRDLLIVLGVFAVLALAGFALRTGRRAFHIGLIAAGVAYSIVTASWALSEHSSWTNLLFQLFPVPAIDESARLIALFALPAAALNDKRLWIAFALGFAALEAGAIAWLSAGQTATPPDLLAPLVALSLHFALGVGALAMKARNAPPMLIFCVLALVHGGHNGAWIAATNAYGLWTLVAIQAVIALAYAGVSYGLLHGSYALRSEDRRID